MMRSKHPLLAGLAATAMAVGGLAAAVPGAWEAFATQARADAWTVYDFADEEEYVPLWDDSGDFPWIYFSHIGDEPLWFFVTEDFGGDPLVGDYAAAGIQAIRSAVFIDDLDEFGLVDCAVFADGPAGLRYYYSSPYFASEFDDAGWYDLRFGFDEPWEYFDETGYVEVPVTEGMLASITEIGFRFFPRSGTTVTTTAKLTDVLLEPTVEAPQLDVSVEGSVFRLGFAMAAANSHTIERLQLPAMEWQDVPGQSELLGPGQHLFTQPVTAGPGIFRVFVEAFYTPIGIP